MNLQKRTARGAARALPLRLRWCFANELSASAPRIPATTTTNSAKNPNWGSASDWWGRQDASGYCRNTWRSA